MLFISRHIIISNIQEHNTIFLKKNEWPEFKQKFCLFVVELESMIISRNISVRQVELLGFDFIFG